MTHSLWDIVVECVSESEHKNLAGRRPTGYFSLNKGDHRVSVDSFVGFQIVSNWNSWLKHHWTRLSDRVVEMYQTFLEFFIKKKLYILILYTIPGILYLLISCVCDFYSSISRLYKCRVLVQTHREFI